MEGDDYVVVTLEWAGGVEMAAVNVSSPLG